MSRRPAKTLVSIVMSGIRSGVKTTPRNKPRTLRQICGATIWSKLNTEEVRYLGRVVQRMAQKGLLGLHPTGTNGANSETYIVL